MKSKAALTLDRVLSQMGLASRTTAREAIRAGRLKVNGRVTRDPELWVHPGRDVVHLDGERLKQARRFYLLFYKPKGVITSHGDPSGRKTVYDYLEGPERSEAQKGHKGQKDKLPWVFPVGRLDKDTSGALLLTNDTEFSDFVTNPESQVCKTYLVKVSGLLDDETVARLAAGVQMKRGDWARPSSLRRLEDRGKYTWLEVVLTEGKNREVRRMIEAVGFRVLKLVRTRIGPLTLEGLEVGKWRALAPTEVAAIRKG
jgi:pseudouridine synthase